MNEFKVCDICDGYNSEELINRLKELDNKAEFVVGCQSMCAIGATKPFVIVNGILNVGETIDEVIEKVTNTMNK